MIVPAVKGAVDFPRIAGDLTRGQRRALKRFATGKDANPDKLRELEKMGMLRREPPTMDLKLSPFGAMVKLWIS